MCFSFATVASLRQAQCKPLCLKKRFPLKTVETPLSVSVVQNGLLGLIVNLQKVALRDFQQPFSQRCQTDFREILRCVTIACSFYCATPVINTPSVMAETNRATRIGSAFLIALDAETLSTPSCAKLTPWKSVIYSPFPIQITAKRDPPNHSKG